MGLHQKKHINKKKTEARKKHKQQRKKKKDQKRKKKEIITYTNTHIPTLEPFMQLLNKTIIHILQKEVIVYLW